MIKTDRCRLAVATPFVVGAIVFGLAMIIYTYAAGTSTAFEAESGALGSGATTLSITGASGSAAVKFASAPTPTPTPVAGGMPTRDNTGPRYAMTDMTPAQFYSSKTCNKQRINGSIELTQSWMRGQIFNITDCEISGDIYVYLIGGDQQLTATEMPVVNLNYSDVGGIASENAFKLNVDHSYIGSKVQLKLSDGWPYDVPGYAPYVFTNTLIYNAYASQPAHTETLQTAGYGTGTSFTNVVFMQQGGPIANTGVTAAINYVGDGTIFDGCFFLWDGEAPAWYTVYISGPRVIVRNSWFDAASGGDGYVYPNTPAIMPTFTNNRNYRTNQLLDLP